MQRARDIFGPLLEQDLTREELKRIEDAAFKAARNGDYKGFWGKVYDHVISDLRGLGAKAEVEEYERRREMLPKLQTLVDETLDRLLSLAEKHYGERKKLYPVAAGLSRFRLEPKHVGAYEPPTPSSPYAVLSVHPGAVWKPGFVRVIVKHELVHHVIDHYECTPEHGEQFQRFASALGLPKKYQD